MTRDVKLGLRFVATATLVYVLAFGAIYFGRDAEVTTYPAYILPIAALIPLFFATFFATRFIEAAPERMSRREIVTFGAICVFGCLLTSSIVEMVFLSFDDRASVGVLFGASFAVSTSVVVAYVSFLRVPVTVRMRLGKPKAQG